MILPFRRENGTVPFAWNAKNCLRRPMNGYTASTCRETSSRHVGTAPTSFAASAIPLLHCVAEYRRVKAVYFGALDSEFEDWENCSGWDVFREERRGDLSLFLRHHPRFAYLIEPRS